MIRLPALRQDSTIGQNCSKAAIKAEVLQLPSRTQRTLIVASGRLARWRKSSSLLINDASLLVGIPANVHVERFGQTDLQYVVAIETSGLQVSCKSYGKLVINQKLHDVWSTTWSV